MGDVIEEPHDDGSGASDAGEDSLAEAAAAGPPIDWDDEGQTPDGPSRTTAANDADPLHSIYGPPPGEGRDGG